MNLLAGRAVRRALHPFVPEELGASFSLASTPEWGALPIVWAAADRRDVLDTYVQMYLKEEIQAEAATRNLPGFARFLPIAGLFHGQTLNVSALARDVGVARTTVQGYLGILEDTLFTFRLPAFEARLRVRERRHPKLYWVDPGLVRAVISDRGPPDADSVGRLFEGWVAQLLRAYRDYRKIFDDLVYWAPTESGEAEVDFLLHCGRERLAIEVKASRRWKPEHASGDFARSPAFLASAAASSSTLVRSGSDPRGIEVLPLAAFLSEPERGLG